MHSLMTIIVIALIAQGCASFPQKSTRCDDKSAMLFLGESDAADGRPAKYNQLRSKDCRARGERFEKASYLQGMINGYEKVATDIEARIGTLERQQGARSFFPRPGEQRAIEAQIMRLAVVRGEQSHAQDALGFIVPQKNAFRAD